MFPFPVGGPELGWTLVLGGSAVVAVAAMLRRLTGFGFAMIAVALLSLTIRVEDAVLTTLLLQLFLGLKNARFIAAHTKWSFIPWIAVGAVAGTPAGLLVISHANESVLRLAIGLFVLLGLVPMWSAERIRLTATPAKTVFSGFLAAFLNSTAAMPGPPLVGYLMATRDIDLETRRATLIGIFTFLCIVSVVGWATAGRIVPGAAWLAVLLMPATFLGDQLGRALHVSFSRVVINRLSVAIAATSAAAMIVPLL